MNETHDTPVADAIIVYDGHCNLCNRSLQFVLKHDRLGTFAYIPFQSLQGQAISKRFDIEFDESTSMLLLEDRQLFTASQAWQRILRRLSLRFRLLSGLIRILPTSCCDWVYRYIGNRRYRWFGNTETCRLVERRPLPEIIDLEKRLPSNPK